MKPISSVLFSRLKTGVCLTFSIVLFSGCMTSSKEGSLAVAGLAYQQKGESTATVDGKQIADIAGKVVDIAEKAEKALTIGGQVSSVADVAKALASGAAIDATKAKEDAVTARSGAEKAKQDAESARLTSDKSKEKIDALQLELGITRVQLDQALEKLGQIDPEMREKLEKISADQIREIAKLKDDRVEFDKKVDETLVSLKLSDAEIKNFKEKTEGMSTEEIIGLLIAAGAGGALGKVGKSRSQPEIDQLKEKVSKIENKST